MSYKKDTRYINQEVKMKKEDIVTLRFDITFGGKKIKAETAAVVVETYEKHTSNTVVIFIDGNLVKVPVDYVKLVKDK